MDCGEIRFRGSQHRCFGPAADEARSFTVADQRPLTPPAPLVLRLLLSAMRCGWLAACIRPAGGFHGYSRTELRISDQRHGLQCELDGRGNHRQPFEGGNPLEEPADLAGKSGRRDLQPGKPALQCFDRHKFADRPPGRAGAKGGIEFRHRCAGADRGHRLGGCRRAQRRRE